MYLQSQHVKNENDGLQSLQVQEAALLTAIDCLHLAKVPFCLIMLFVYHLHFIGRKPMGFHWTDSHNRTLSQVTKKRLRWK